MQKTLIELLSNDQIMKADLPRVVFAAMDGDPDEAQQRFMTASSVLWQTTSSPDYKGDITDADLEKFRL